MEFRNARFNQYGTIDCEINDPQFGWIPFTASPDDTYSVGHEVFEAAKDVAEPYIPPTPEEILAAELAAAQANRQIAYTQEADPLFFKYQRGEATEREWLDKIEEIRERYPYPEE